MEAERENFMQKGKNFLGVHLASSERKEAFPFPENAF